MTYLFRNFIAVEGFGHKRRETHGFGRREFKRKGENGGKKDQLRASRQLLPCCCCCRRQQLKPPALDLCLEEPDNKPLLLVPCLQPSHREHPCHTPVSSDTTRRHTGSSSISLPGQPPQLFHLECNPAIPSRNTYILFARRSSLQGEHPSLPFALSGFLWVQFSSPRDVHSTAAAQLPSCRCTDVVLSKDATYAYSPAGGANTHNPFHPEPSLVGSQICGWTGDSDFRSEDVTGSHYGMSFQVPAVGQELGKGRADVCQLIVDFFLGPD
ncbi:hypothetical protein UY3_07766 [Chelonia mydas]|uniref:Uncharacterized protein n=1 Tax=Chelonia mydas TaxID=8469 RepID=M7BSJ0_CHEMY|nr:hypothetical protein UY3_07766 [Chelonia mydas]